LSDINRRTQIEIRVFENRVLRGMLACSMHGGNEKSTQNFVWRARVEATTQKDPGIGGRIILKLISRK
jgi:hypothetical protein